MKSSSHELESRGHLEFSDESYAGVTLAQRLQLLKSMVAVDRTLGARLLDAHNNCFAIEHLVDALKIEKKLYPRIEICNSLASYGIYACEYLIPLLGKIGTNQHAKIPVGHFKKNSYPLPRDIVSRILIRIGPPVLPYLWPVLLEKDDVRVSEAVDAVGFICFYRYQAGVYERLKACIQNNTENDLVKWKVFRALSACPESKLFLTEQKIVHTGTLLYELERSLRIIDKQNFFKRKK